MTNQHKRSEMGRYDYEMVHDLYSQFSKLQGRRKENFPLFRKGELALNAFLDA